jgi:saccharopine dehydrogenase (NAD+, L-lysine-forming)
VVGQSGWDTVLARFPRGGGTLLDLEFLQDPATGRRVAAFGYSAGFSGSALALKNWAWQQTHSAGELLPGVESYQNEPALITDVKKDLEAARAKTGRLPRVIVIGALGRCGRGAVDMCLKAGIPDEQILKWDMAETAKGGPFKEISHESDIFVNCTFSTSHVICSRPLGDFLNYLSRIIMLTIVLIGIYLSSKIQPVSETWLHKSSS